jgi:hypothetical protein
MSKAFRMWKERREGPYPLRRAPLPKRLFIMRNYRMLKRRNREYQKWLRKTALDFNSKVENQRLMEES